MPNKEQVGKGLECTCTSNYNLHGAMQQDHVCECCQCLCLSWKGRKGHNGVNNIIKSGIVTCNVILEWVKITK